MTTRTDAILRSRKRIVQQSTRKIRLRLSLRRSSRQRLQSRRCFEISRQLSSLGGKNLGVAGATALAVLLRSNTVWEAIFCNNNAISSKGVKALAASLKVSTTLKTLYLGVNKVVNDITEVGR